MAFRCLSGLQKLGWRVPEEIGIACVGEGSSPFFDVVNLSGVVPTDTSLVETATDLLKDQLETGGVTRRVVPPRLRLGETCLPLAATTPREL
jgi:DNA-binding LacI/PurR family transcriptional regulator